MPKKSAKNNSLLKSIKANTSPQIYNLILDLINEGKDELAEIVLKIDYLLDYASTCIRQNDYNEATETLHMAENRIYGLRKENVDTKNLEYLYEGLLKKLKK